MKLRILNPHAFAFNGEASLVIVPGKEGSFGVLDGHAPVLAAMRPGTVTVDTAEGRKEFPVSGGVAEVTQSQVTILDF